MLTTRFIALICLLNVSALAAEIRVMVSGGFAGAFSTLSPQFERQTGHKVVTIPGASMGATPDAIPNRLAHGQAADVVIMVNTALDLLISSGKVRPDSKTDLVLSRIALAVKEGSPGPDISTPDAFRQALLNAHSVALSDSASGVYISGELFRGLGIADQMRPKYAMIPGTPVGLNIAQGQFVIGLQQLSELLQRGE